MAKQQKVPLNSKSECPCQSGLLFHQCCQQFLKSDTPESATLFAKTAEQLMRSRYCAYILGKEAYLLHTWHPGTRPNSLHLDDSPNHWIGLKIKETTAGQVDDTTGTVHFIARYKENGKAYKLEESSLFEKINGQWFYVRAN